MKLKLTNVRLSFPNLFEAEQYEGKGPSRYGASFWVANDDPQRKTIDDALQAVAAEAWGQKAKANLAEVLPDKKACCWIDGARKDAEGHWVLSTYRKQEKGRPLVIDQSKNPLVAADGKPYAGCYVNATIDVYATGKPNMGLRAETIGVQFARDGDAFSGGSMPNPDDFDEIAAGSDAGALV